MRCREPLVTIVGAAGTGKSVAALLKLHVTCLLVPGTTCLILRQTAKSLSGSTLRTFENVVASEEIGSQHVVWFGGSGRKPAAYMYPNGSIIMVGGLDQPGKFLSMDLDRVMIDEASQVGATALEVILTRMRGKAPTYRQVILATNPDHPEHHIRERALKGGMPMFTSVHRDNPHLFDRNGIPTPAGKDYLNILEGLSGIRRARYLEGRWVAAEGQVYDDWNDAVHLIDPFDVPADWRSVWVWDQGFQNPQVFQRWVLDGDGRAYLTHEMSRRQRLAEDFARDIAELREANGWKWPEVFLADHDAGERATMERHLRFPTFAANKVVTRGVQLGQARMKVQPDGKPRMAVFRNALIRNDSLAATDKRPRGFAAEVGGYVWGTERGDDGVPKEVPVKKNDHSMDCYRYLCMYLDGMAPAALGNPARPGTSAPSQGGKWSRPVGR